MDRFTGLLGLMTMLGLAYAFSTNRKANAERDMPTRNASFATVQSSCGVS